MNLDEQFVKGEVVFSGTLLDVRRDEVLLPDGNQATREYVLHPGACVVIPEVAPGIFLLERQFRYPLRQIFLEFPAGKVDQGESRLSCAQRELREETGYLATQWRHLGVMHNCIGYSDESIDIFLAQGLTAGAQSLDEGEFVELTTMSLEEAERGVRGGMITDAKTITCLFWLRLLNS